MNEKRPEISEIKRLIVQAGEMILAAHLKTKEINTKSSKRDIVTVYDKAVQKFLIDELSALYPQAGFFCEESDVKCDCGKGVWFIIDPIDGTTNFVRGLMYSCVSIGCAIDGVPELGAVYNPYTKELFSAERGKGAFLDDERIHCSENTLDESLIMIGTSPYSSDNTGVSFELARVFYDKALDIRRSGSAALDLCYVAAGRIDLYFELMIAPWDYAAGALIVREAGGVVSKADGGEIDISKSCGIVADNGLVHEQYLEIAAPILSKLSK